MDGDKVQQSKEPKSSESGSTRSTVASWMLILAPVLILGYIVAARPMGWSIDWFSPKPMAESEIIGYWVAEWENPPVVVPFTEGEAVADELRRIRAARKLPRFITLDFLEHGTVAYDYFEWDPKLRLGFNWKSGSSPRSSPRLTGSWKIMDENTVEVSYPNSGSGAPAELYRLENSTLRRVWADHNRNANEERIFKRNTKSYVSDKLDKQPPRMEWRDGVGWEFLGDPKTASDNNINVKPTKEDVIGVYELIVGPQTFKRVVLANGVFEKCTDNKKSLLSAKWKIRDGELVVTWKIGESIYRIESDGGITWIADVADGKRTDFPKREQQFYRKIR